MLASPWTSWRKSARRTNCNGSWNKCRYRPAWRGGEPRPGAGRDLPGSGTRLDARTGRRPGQRTGVRPGRRDAIQSMERVVGRIPGSRDRPHAVAARGGGCAAHRGSRCFRRLLAFQPGAGVCEGRDSGRGLHSVTGKRRSDRGADARRERDARVLDGKSCKMGTNHRHPRSICNRTAACGARGAARQPGTLPCYFFPGSGGHHAGQPRRKTPPCDES